MEQQNSIAKDAQKPLHCGIFIILKISIIFTSRTKNTNHESEKLAMKILFYINDVKV